jgi:[acyl-carrier-protein] S-malonyltransferase
MSHKRACFIFPGQGAQAVGMMKDFYESFAESRQVFEEAEDILKTSITDIIFHGPKEALTQTVNCQKAIFVASYAVLKAFEAQAAHIKPVATAGLSLGEYTALAASKRATFSDLLPVVHQRATLMQSACEAQKSSMNVVLGQEGDWVDAVLKESGLPVWVANLNCPGQVVIAGDVSSLEKAAELIKAAGAKRVLPLDVSGAFHTPLMESAKVGLRPYLEALPLVQSDVSLVMNAVGHSVSDSDQIRQLLIEQVTSPVYWAKGIQSLSNSCDLFIEMGPGSTLAGMNKRIGVTAPTFSIQSVADLEQVLNQIEALYATKG